MKVLPMCKEALVVCSKQELGNDSSNQNGPKTIMMLLTLTAVRCNIVFKSKANSKASQFSSRDCKTATTGTYTCNSIYSEHTHSHIHTT